MPTQTEQAARMMLAALSPDVPQMNAAEAGNLIVRMAKQIEKERKQRRDAAIRASGAISLDA